MAFLEKEDYFEPACCLKSGGNECASPVGERIPVREILSELDALYSREKNADGSVLLCGWLERARALGDWSGELSMLCELMGHYRRTSEGDKGLAAVRDGLAIIKKQNIGHSISGATAMLNAATTLKAFGQAEESVAIFSEVCRVYSNLLDPHDYRFAGLYNNMALSHADVGETALAEKYFLRAGDVLSHCEGSENEQAVTLCNLCELYDRIDPTDERIAPLMEQAFGLLCSPQLPHDGYHAFNISKCAPTFERLGFFRYAKILEERARGIYERAD